jgi:hypothetical protein
MQNNNMSREAHEGLSVQIATDMLLETLPGLLVHMQNSMESAVDQVE